QPEPKDSQVAGFDAGDFAFARFTANGTVDTTFGASGKVILDLGGDDEAVAAVRVQSDGKIVVAGSMEVGGDRDWLLARFTAAGALDTTFNSVGYVTTDLLGYDDEVHALVIQSDGK